MRRLMWAKYDRYLSSLVSSETPPPEELCWSDERTWAYFSRSSPLSSGICPRCGSALCSGSEREFANGREDGVVSCGDRPGIGSAGSGSLAIRFGSDCSEGVRWGFGGFWVVDFAVSWRWGGDGWRLGVASGAGLGVPWIGGGETCVWACSLPCALEEGDGSGGVACALGKTVLFALS